MENMGIFSYLAFKNIISKLKEFHKNLNIFLMSRVKLINMQVEHL